MKNKFKNWKTTLFGISSILGAVVFFLKGNIPEGITSITTGLGLLHAKDFDKE